MTGLDTPAIGSTSDTNADNPGTKSEEIRPVKKPFCYPFVRPASQRFEATVSVRHLLYRMLRVLKVAFEL